MNCETCNEPATISVRRDPFGKSEGWIHLCPKHAPSAFVSDQARIAALEARCRELEARPLAKRAVRLEAGFRAQETRIAELETSLEKYQACRVHDVDEKAWLSKRMTELEAALQKWSDKCTGLHGSQIKCVNETLQNLKIASASETK